MATSLQALTLPLRGLGWWATSQVLFTGELVRIVGALVLRAPREFRRFDRRLFVGELRRTGVAGLAPVLGLASALGVLLLVRLLALPGGEVVGRFVFRQVIVELGPVVVAATLLLHASPLMAGTLGLDVARDSAARRDPDVTLEADPYGVTDAIADPHFLFARAAPRVLGAIVSAALLWGLFSVVGLAFASIAAVVVTKADFATFLHRQVADVPPLALADALVRSMTFGLAVSLVAVHEALRTKAPMHLPSTVRLAVVRGFFVCLVLFTVSRAPALAELVAG